MRHWVDHNKHNNQCVNIYYNSELITWGDAGVHELIFALNDSTPWPYTNTLIASLEYTCYTYYYYLWGIICNII